MSIPAQPDPVEQKAVNNSLGELLSEVSNDLSTLIRQETELAKAELRESAKRAGKGAGMMGGAGLAGYLALLFLTIAIWMGLALLVGLGWSALIIAVVYGVVAAILFFSGKKKLETVEGAPQTVETTKQIPDALKPD